MENVIIDYSASVVSDGRMIRESAEAASRAYSSDGAYFAELTARSREDIGGEICGFLLIDGLLKKHKVDRAEVSLDIAEDGKPFASSGDLDVSTAHADGCVFSCVALGEGVTVGCDIRHAKEYSSEKITELASKFMDSEELAALYYSKERKADFFVAWTRREAYAKRLGKDSSELPMGVDLSGEMFIDKVITSCGERFYCCVNYGAAPKEQTEE